MSLLVKPNSSSIISIARGLVGSRLIYPFSSNVLRCEWTEEVERKPTLSHISLTVGG